MKKNVFFMGMLAMVLAFGLVMIGCGSENEAATSISISGTAKVGETLTAVINNPLDGNATQAASSVEWHYYSNAACTNRVGGSGYSDGGTPWVIPAGAGEKWIRASSYGFTGDGKNCDDIYSNTLGPVEAAPDGGTGVTPATASVAKGTTQQFIVTINEFVGNSNSIVWTVEGSTPTGTSTITGTGQSLNGSTTTQTRTLNVGAAETATTLTVKVTYNGQSDTATVTVQ
jgi:hypothetical protein